jgi:CRP-like cAMP-binding protein
MEVVLEEGKDEIYVFFNREEALTRLREEQEKDKRKKRIAKLIYELPSLYEALPGDNDRAKIVWICLKFGLSDERIANILGLSRKTIQRTYQDGFS